MSTDRLETIRSWVDQDPDDAFSRYALAMELNKHERFEEAVEQFRELMQRNPDHCATYYHYGSLLAKLARKDEARAVLVKGLEVTKAAGEEHANSELQEALTVLDGTA